MTRRRDDREYSTSQVSRLVGASQAKVRRWCDEGLIDCSITGGGHFRIPAYAVEQIKKSGEPELPRRPASRRGSPSPHKRRVLDDPPAELYREASDELSESAEDVKIVENRVRRRKADLELAQIEDVFDARNRQKVVEERESRRKIEEVSREEERNRWLREKLDWALNPKPLPPGWEAIEVALEFQGTARRSAAGLPSDAPVDIKVAVAKGVLGLLESVDPSVMTDELVKEQIAALVKDIWGRIANASRPSSGLRRDTGSTCSKRSLRLSEIAISHTRSSPSGT